MKLNWQAAMIILTLTFIIGYLVRFGCSKPKPQIIFKDTTTTALREKNKEIDELSKVLFNEYEKHDTKLSVLRDSIKKAKYLYRDRIKIVKEAAYVSDTAKIKDLNEALDLSENFISFQDSLLIYLDTALANRNEVVKLLQRQVEINKVRPECCVELSKYRHFLFRLYRKKS